MTACNIGFKSGNSTIQHVKSDYSYDYTFVQNQCKITNVRGQVSDCDISNRKFNLKLNFDHDNSADSFRVGGNAFNYGTFAYKDLPVTLRNISLSQFIEYEFLIVDKIDPFCFASFELGFISDCRDTCALTIINIAPLSCDSSGVALSLSMNDDFGGVNGFSLYVNANKVKDYRYSPVDYIVDMQKLNCDSNYIFKVVDLDQKGCSNEIEYQHTDSICCISCKLSELQISVLQCDYEGFGLVIDFKYEYPGEKFQVKINDILKGSYLYKDLPISISDINEKGDMRIQISDITKENCILNTTVQAKDCYSALAQTDVNTINILVKDNTLYIENSSASNIGIVSIYDITGRQILAKTFHSELEIDIGNWQSSVYIVFVRAGREVLRQKLSKF